MESGIADQASPRGRVRVSTSMAHGRMVIVPLLGTFVERYPGISVEIDINDQIADVLGISVKTVELHRSNMMNKLGVRSLPELMKVALGHG